MSIQQPEANAKATANPPLKDWRDLLPIHPAANKIPVASEDERRGLARDLAKHGQKVPVVLVRVAGGPLQLLDGRHRLDLLEITGIKAVGDDGSVLVKHEIVDVADDAEAERLSLSLNAHRRHLSARKKREVIADMLKASPEKSNRQIGEQLKADHKTVASVRAEKESTGEIPQLTESTGKDGKVRPINKKRRDADDFKKDIAAKKAATAAATTSATPVQTEAHREARAEPDAGADVREVEQQANAADSTPAALQARILELEQELKSAHKNIDGANVVIAQAKAILATKAIFSAEMYKTIREAVHPDRVTDKKMKARYEEAFKFITEHEPMLARKPPPPRGRDLPSTSADWAAAKIYAQEERRAKAAATRATKKAAKNAPKLSGQQAS